MRCVVLKYLCSRGFSVAVYKLFSYFSASSTGNNVSVDECKVSIRCSDFNTNENCTINYRQDGMDINRTIPPSSMVSLQLEIELFQVIIKNGSLILQQNFDVLNGK